MRNADKILIVNMKAHALIGIYEHERHQPREILLNITIYTDTRRAARTDRIEDCVDYDQISQEIRALVEGAQRYTVEALAEDIALLCLGKPRVSQVTVRVEKPGAVAGAESVGVEIFRQKRLYL